MVALPHAAVGMAVAKLARRPLLAFPLAFLSHVVLDAIPHTNYPWLVGQPSSDLALWGTIGLVLDTELSLLLILTIAMPRHDRRLLIGGAVCGVLPDVVELLPVVGPLLATWPVTEMWVHLHHSLQDQLPPPPLAVGILTQVLATVAGVWIVRKRRRKRDLSRPAPVPGGARLSCSAPAGARSPASGSHPCTRSRQRR